jgi:hypothetical protein
MDRRHGDACDFRLVSTYLPYLATIARAQALVCAGAVVASHVPAHVGAALLLLAAYFDALLDENTCSSALGGHL